MEPVARRVTPFGSQSPAADADVAPLSLWFDESGYTLAEFLVASLILVLISTAVFDVLGEVQQVSSHQTEVQEVLDNTRIAVDAIERYVRSAGNDPSGRGVVGISIISPSEVRIRSDLTGSAGPGNPDKGDPDGDTSDSGEDVIIRYNAAARSIEIVPYGGTAQPIANGISGLAIQSFNAAGGLTGSGADAVRVRVAVSSASTFPDPRTGRTFGLTMERDIQIANRRD